MHCTVTAGSAGVKVQNIWNGRNNIACGADCKYRTAAILFTVRTGFVWGVKVITGIIIIVIIKIIG